MADCNRTVEELIAEHERVGRELEFLYEKDERTRRLVDEARSRTKIAGPVRVQTLEEYRILEKGRRVEELTVRQLEDSLDGIRQSVSELETKRDRLARAAHFAGMPEKVFVALPTRPGQFVFLHRDSDNVLRLHTVPEGAIGLGGDPDDENYVEELLYNARRLERFAGLNSLQKLLSWGKQVFLLVPLVVFTILALVSLPMPLLLPFAALLIGEWIGKTAMFLTVLIPILVLVAVLRHDEIFDTWGDVYRDWRSLSRPPEGLKRSEIPPAGWKETA